MNARPAACYKHPSREWNAHKDAAVFALFYCERGKQRRRNDSRRKSVGEMIMRIADKIEGMRKKKGSRQRSNELPGALVPAPRCRGSYGLHGERRSRSVLDLWKRWTARKRTVKAQWDCGHICALSKHSQTVVLSSLRVYCTARITIKGST